jgi:hypothetical protein
VGETSCQKEIAKNTGEGGGLHTFVEREAEGLYEAVKECFEGMESRNISELLEDVWQSGEEKGPGRLGGGRAGRQTGPF